jgi:hypothetical protein
MAGNTRVVAVGGTEDTSGSRRLTARIYYDILRVLVGGVVADRRTAIVELSRLYTLGLEALDATLGLRRCLPPDAIPGVADAEALFEMLLSAIEQAMMSLRGIRPYTLGHAAGTLDQMALASSVYRSIGGVEAYDYPLILHANYLRGVMVTSVYEDPFPLYEAILKAENLGLYNAREVMERLRCLEAYALPSPPPIASNSA